MTPEQRKAAAEVMASDGPWDCIAKYGDMKKWRQCEGEPNWNWNNFEFRVRPKPIVRYVNFYHHGYGSTNYESRKQADGGATDGRFACVRVPVLPGQFDE